MNPQSVAASFASWRSGSRESDPSTVFESATPRQQRAFDEIEGLCPRRRYGWLPRTTARPAAWPAGGVDERDPVRSAVLQIDVDPEVRARGECPGQRLSAVPRPESFPLTSTTLPLVRGRRHRCRQSTISTKPPESATDLVVVDLVEDQMRADAGEGGPARVSQVSVMRSVAVEPTSTRPAAPSNVVQGVPWRSLTEESPAPGVLVGPGGPADRVFLFSPLSPFAPDWSRPGGPGLTAHAPGDLGLVAFAGFGRRRCGRDRAAGCGRRRSCSCPAPAAVANAAALPRVASTPATSAIRCRFTPFLLCRWSTGERARPVALGLVAARDGYAANRMAMRSVDESSHFGRGRRHAGGTVSPPARNLHTICTRSETEAHKLGP